MKDFLGTIFLSLIFLSLLFCLYNFAIHDFANPSAYEPDTQFCTSGPNFATITRKNSPM